MNKYILLLILLLTGCGTLTRQEPPVIIKQPDPIKVEIPVYKPCVTDEIPLPELYMGKLTQDDIADPGKVVQYYAADVTQLKGIVLRQKAFLDACRNGKPQPVIAAPVVSLPPAPVIPSEPAPPIVAPVPEQPKPAPKPRAALKPSGKTFSPPPPVQ